MAKELQCLGSEYNVVCTSATALTPPTGLKPNHCIINVNGGTGVRYLTDGANPTTTRGVFVAVNGQISFMDPDFSYTTLIKKIRIIQTAASSTLDVLYFT